MLPRPHMVTTINKPVFKLLLGVFLGAVMLGCKPPGPKALLDGKRHLENGRIAVAVDRLQAATRLIPTNANAWNYLGIACHSAGQISNAVVAYQNALRIDPDLSEVRLNLGSLQLEQGRFAEAKYEFTAYSLRRPGDPVGFKQLALAELQLGDLAAAESHARKATALAASDAEAWNALGLIQLRLRRNADSIQSFRSALEQQSSFAPARINLAVALQEAGDLSGALEAYRQYLKSTPRPSDADLIEHLIVQIEGESTPKPLLLTQNEPSRNPARIAPNIQTQMASIALAPQSARQVVPQRGARLVDTNKTSTSNVSSGRASPKAPVQLATSVGDISQSSVVATEKSDHVRALHPNSPRSLELATNVVSVAERERVAGARNTNPTVTKAAEKFAAQGARALAAKRYGEAADAFRSAVNVDPNWFQAQLNYSAAAIHAGRTEEAVRAGQRALALQPDSARARYNLALALKQAARYRDSAAQLEALLAENASDARAHLTLANLYADDLGQVELARRHYLKVLEIEPRHPQAAEINFWLASNPAK